MQGEGRPLIRRALFALRLSLGGFFLFWGVMALQGPARGKVLFASLPNLTLAPELALLLAVAEIALGVFIASGLLRGLAYGLGFFLQALAVFASHHALLHPMEGANALYWSTLPVLAAYGVLFVLRGEDRLFALDSVMSQNARAERSARSGEHSAGP